MNQVIIQNTQEAHLLAMATHHNQEIALLHQRILVKFPPHQIIIYAHLMMVDKLILQLDIYKKGT